VGIPLDLLAPTLDTPSEFSRQASFSTTERAPLTLVLKGDRRTHPVGWSALPRGSYGGVCLPYLVTEGRVMAVHFLARWACLFRREPLRRGSVGGIRNVLLEREIRLLGGAFIGEITAIVGSAFYRTLINIRASPGCRPFRILPLPSLLLSCTFLRACDTPYPRVERSVESPSTS